MAHIPACGMDLRAESLVVQYWHGSDKMLGARIACASLVLPCELLQSPVVVAAAADATCAIASMTGRKQMRFQDLSATLT
jgi:hypothetical protein